MSYCMKKTGCVLLAVLTAVLCCMAVAADGNDTDATEYTIERYMEKGIIYNLNTQYHIAEVDGSDASLSGEVTIPSKVTFGGESYSVTRIDANAFANRRDITIVHVENGITQINANAFQNCSALRELYLPDTITYVFPSAFDGCGNLTVHAYKEGNNLELLKKTTGVNYVFYKDGFTLKKFFQGIWQAIKTGFDRLIYLLKSNLSFS